eukprot:134774-Chlamydomonas_euryale.AAC.1
MELPFYFLDAQASGPLPVWNRVALGKPGGWRGDSHLFDGQGYDAVDANVTGGWYDLDGHVKSTLTIAFTTHTLGLSGLIFEVGFRDAGHWDSVVQQVQLGARYLLAAHVRASDDPAANALVAQVGDVDTDAAYWGRPEEQQERGVENTPAYRPAWVADAVFPGGDVAGAASAALAAAVLVSRRPGLHQDLALANEAYRHAVQLLRYAVEYPRVWRPPEGRVRYNTTSVHDHIALAHALVCMADYTQPSICNVAANRWQAGYLEYGRTPAPLNQARVRLQVDAQNVLPWASVAMLFSGISKTPASGDFDWQYNQHIASVLDAWRDTNDLCSDVSIPPCQTPTSGFAYFGVDTRANVAVNGKNAAAQLLAAMHAQLLETAARLERPGTVELTRPRELRCWAHGQLRHITGDNPMGVSFLVGYGDAYPRSPRQRSAACPADRSLPCLPPNGTQPNPNTLSGALVGGYLLGSNEFTWSDLRSNVIGNTAGIADSASVPGMAAALVQLAASLP